MAYIFPKKIFPSALNYYLRCPFKFKCHNDKDVKAEFIESPENFVGNAVHMVLKDFFDITKVPIDKRKEQNLGAMLRSSWARVGKGNHNDYWSAKERIELFGSAEQEKAFGLNAIAMLNNYILNADLTIVPLSLEDWMECGIGEFKIAGRIDRIDQDSESSISVWDYKTGKLPFYNKMEKIIEEDLQIPIYAIIASRLNPFAQKIKAGLIYLKYSKTYDIVWAKEELEKFENKIIDVIKQAKNDNLLLPKIGKLCPWCEYKGICPEMNKIKENKGNIDEVMW